MKPNFALSLSYDGISLLHRRFPGWTIVGEVSLDTDDLDAALASLRESAVALDPSGLRTKLLIPNDQIKYLSVPAGKPGAEGDTARAALDGATPYAVDELVFDWSRDGDTLHIAAVARETLQEAESFATDHAFAPVSFVAVPDKGSFNGEPFLGQTTHARTLLPPGAEVERDTAPVRIIGLSKPTQDKDNTAPVVPADAPATPASAPAAQDTAPKAAPEKPAPAPAAEPAPKPESPGKQAAKQATPQPTVSDTHGAARKPDAAASDPAGDKDARDAGAKPDAPAKAPAKPGAASVKAPEKPAEAPRPFASIRASRGDVPSAAPKLSAPSRLTGLSAPSRDSGLRPGAADATTPAPTLPSPGAEALVDPAQMAQAAASLRPDPEQRLDMEAAPEAPKRAGEPKKPRPTFFSGRKPRTKGAAASSPSSTAATTPARKPQRKTTHEDEKQRMTIFGAREQPVGGKPRFLGLILTAVLLLFLVGVAAWASIFLDDGLARLLGGSGDIRVSDVPSISEEEADAPGDTETPDTVETAALTPETEAAPQVSDVPDVAGSEEAQAPPAEQELTPDAALSRYAATGIWQMAPDAPAPPRTTDDAERLFDVSLDPDVQLGSPDSLPSTRPEPGDAAPPLPGEPPPAGVTFDFDENGLVRATPWGAETPLGITVYSGRPSLEPPAEMQREDQPTTGDTATAPPAEDAADDPATDADADTTTNDAPEPAQEPDASTGDVAAVMGDPDSPLAEIRPRPRPAALVPDATGSESEPASEPDAAGTDESALDPETAEDSGDTVTAVNSALAGIRPRARPASVAQKAEDQTASQAAEVDQASLDNAIALAAEAASGASATQFDDATPQAVSASLTPNLRPSDFASTVARARESVAAQPVATAQVLAPSIPTSTSVAREATTQNAIKLRDVNLIGVYGTSASRRALVRLANGRYKKVKVGDSLDGGKVAAIGDSELRYVKRGRNVVLRIPKG